MTVVAAVLILRLDCATCCMLPAARLLMFAYVVSQVLQHCSPVLHAVLNVMKRMVVLMACVMMTRTPFTQLQMVGVVISHIAAGLMSIQKTGLHSSSHSADILPAAIADREVLTETASGVEASNNAATAAPTSATAPAAITTEQSTTSNSNEARNQHLGRLAIVIAVVAMASTVGVMCVLFTFQQPSSSGLRTVSVQGSKHAISLHAAVSPGSTTELVWNPSHFVFRDAQRVKCLRTLHDVSKVRM